MRELLASLERDGADLPALLAYLAGVDVDLDDEKVGAALRRAELLLASGGDPRRELDPDGRAVAAVAADLDAAHARASLLEGLERLAAEADGLPAVAATLTRLRGDPDVAWRAYACALLAEELAAD